jgi:hypothetical protein
VRLVISTLTWTLPVATVVPSTGVIILTLGTVVGVGDGSEVGSGAVCWGDVIWGVVGGDGSGSTCLLVQLGINITIARSIPIYASFECIKVAIFCVSPLS